MRAATAVEEARRHRELEEQERQLAVKSNLLAEQLRDAATTIVVLDQKKAEFVEAAAESGDKLTEIIKISEESGRQRRAQTAEDVLLRRDQAEEDERLQLVRAAEAKQQQEAAELQALAAQRHAQAARQQAAAAAEQEAAALKRQEASDALSLRHEAEQKASANLLDRLAAVQSRKSKPRPEIMVTLPFFLILPKIL